MIRFLNAGESHGDSLLAIVEGLPANLKLDIEFINNQLRRRQAGYGRSSRMEMEDDRINICSGLEAGYTTGNPLSFTIKNKGNNIEKKEFYRVRPGHADLAGSLKYNQDGARNILERASARETASRVAVGAICKLFLKEFGIEISSHIIKLGAVRSSSSYYKGLSKDEKSYAKSSNLRALSKDLEDLYIDEIKAAASRGDSLGGSIELIISNLIPGLGSYSNWDRKIDARLAGALMSVQAIKSVTFGIDTYESDLNGSQYQDEIFYEKGYYRKTNNCGGIEGGMTNGEDIVIRADMKPIPTLRSPLSTVDIKSKEELKSIYERSDICAVSSASYVLEAMAAYVLANELMAKLGGDFMEEIMERYENYKEYLNER